MCHVLVLEDEPMVACYISDLAEDAGATSTHIAATPAEAVASAMACKPEVILSDVQIIDGTGPQAVEEIRRRLGPVPVIYITGTPDACESCDYAAAILTKPVNARHVIHAFRQVAPV